MAIFNSKLFVYQRVNFSKTLAPHLPFSEKPNSCNSAAKIRQVAEQTDASLPQRAKGLLRLFGLQVGDDWVGLIHGQRAGMRHQRW